MSRQTIAKRDTDSGFTAQEEEFFAEGERIERELAAEYEQSLRADERRKRTTGCP